jgi:hypothetical protein
MEKKYYVYEIKDLITNQYYIGSRGCYGEVNEDKYLGSPKTWKPNKKRLIKKIIEVFKTREEAINFERLLIIENLSNELNMNFSIPHTKIHRENLITAKDKSGKIITISKDDPLFGVEYFGVSKGLVLVRDYENNIFVTSVTDPRYINGELTHYNKGKNVGIEHPNFNKIWVNNGIKQKLIDPLEMLTGWVCGTLQKGLDTSSSHKKTIWVNNKNINKRIFEFELNEFIKKGWVLGRVNLKKYKKNIDRKIITPNLKNYKWMCNLEENINKRVSFENVNTFLSKGWIFGRVKIH